MAVGSNMFSSHIYYTGLCVVISVVLFVLGKLWLVEPVIVLIEKNSEGHQVEL
jgi:hypothetical protein